MTQRNTITIESDSPAATEAVAQQIGQRLRGGELIELTSDLGGGKTTFTRGLARGAGSQDIVASPTFTISKVYKTDQLEIHHFDFYRLTDAGLAAHELHDLINDQEIVIVVEWSGVVEHVLPDSRLTIALNRTGDASRSLTLTYPLEYDYLVEGIC